MDTNAAIKWLISILWSATMTAIVTFFKIVSSDNIDEIIDELARFNLSSYDDNSPLYAKLDDASKLEFSRIKISEKKIKNIL